MNIHSGGAVAVTIDPDRLHFVIGNHTGASRRSTVRIVLVCLVVVFAPKSQRKSATCKL